MSLIKRKSVFTVSDQVFDTYKASDYDEAQNCIFLHTKSNGADQLCTFTLAKCLFVLCMRNTGFLIIRLILMGYLVQKAYLKDVS